MRIRAWDGSEAGPPEGPILVIRSRRALRRLFWARVAWAVPVPMWPAKSMSTVTSPADYGGPGRPPTPPAAEARPTGGLHTRLRAAPRSRTTPTCRTTSTRSCSASTWPTRRGISPTTASRCTTPDHQSGSRLQQTRPQAGHSATQSWLRSLILHAPQRYIVHATGITLSAQEPGLHRASDVENAEVRSQDYRDLVKHERQVKLSTRLLRWRWVNTSVQPNTRPKPACRLASTQASSDARAPNRGRAGDHVETFGALNRAATDGAQL